MKRKDQYKEVVSETEELRKKNFMMDGKIEVLQKQLDELNEEIRILKEKKSENLS
jgi:uncharacterized coiled-coil DUF342 family protein